MHSNDQQLPHAFIERLTEILPQEKLKSVIESFSIERPISFRINTLKANVKDVLPELEKLNINLTPVPWFDQAFIVPSDQRERLTHSELLTFGKIYIQSLSSMLAALALEPQPNEEILDLAAAPGSKTTLIACLMQNQGRLAAVEKVKARYFKLKDNLETQGVTIAQTYLKDGAMVFKSCPERFDRVLLDAPCSSEGRFDLNHPQSMQYWSERKIKEMAHKQWRLLYSAFQSLKPNGVLIYSTCTFAPEENELIIAKLLKKFKNAKVMPLNLPIDNVQEGLTQWQEKTLDEQLAHCKRILPNAQMPGFFIARITKSASTD